jgi:hypothetical protein
VLTQVSGRFQQLVEAYSWFNPHLSLSGTWFGREFVSVKATNRGWDKWRPRNPTSAHWYDEARLQRYLAAHVARDRDLGLRRTVREFVAEFRGFSGTAIQRKVLDEVGCSHRSLASFFGVKQVNAAGIAKLLAAMKRLSKLVAPKYLGVIGEPHFRERFVAAGGNAETFNYQCRKNMDDGVPYVVEFAFGLQQSGLDNPAPKGLAALDVARRFVTGVNWSATISNPFRHFGSTGEGLENTLARVRADYGQPVICAVHLAMARVQFADRGKSSIILTDEARQPDE